MNDARSRLRFQSAVDATKVALNRWERCAYGVDQLKDKELRNEARATYVALYKAISSRTDLERT